MASRIWEDNYYVNRTLCEVLEEMRKCNKIRNYAPLESLIEEVQIKANRMESGLSIKKDLNSMEEEWHKLKKKLKELRKEVKEEEC